MKFKKIIALAAALQLAAAGSAFAVSALTANAASIDALSVSSVKTADAALKIRLDKTVSGKNVTINAVVDSEGTFDVSGFQFVINSPDALKYVSSSLGSGFTGEFHCHDKEVAFANQAGDTKSVKKGDILATINYEAEKEYKSYDVNIMDVYVTGADGKTLADSSADTSKPGITFTQAVNSDGKTVINVTAGPLNGKSLSMAGYQFNISKDVKVVSASEGLGWTNPQTFVGNTKTNEFAWAVHSGTESYTEGFPIATITLDKAYPDGAWKPTDIMIVNDKGENITDSINYVFSDEAKGSVDDDFMLGDVTLDKKVDASDATEILAAYSRISTGEPIGLNDKQKKAAEVIKDGKIDASDATAVLQYYSFLSTGGSGSLEKYLGL